jgi:2-amino-4-hydroxy-6-hydroxymethyldihydropteridine diphosphokinase
MSNSPSRKADALIAFGANQGDCQQALQNTLQLLGSDSRVLEITCSTPVETKAVLGDKASKNADSNNTYLNAAIRLLMTWSHSELHNQLVQIEKQLGRERSERWGPRTIDLDLLLVGDLQLRTAELTIPHPRMSFRRFVLAPAAEIAGNMVHPESGMTIKQLLDHLDDFSGPVLFATDDEAFARQCTDDIPFDVQIVTSFQDFMLRSANAKLVVSFFGDSNDNADSHIESLKRFATNFAGPTLRLRCDSTLSQARTELIAANEAMR